MRPEIVQALKDAQSYAAGISADPGKAVMFGQQIASILAAAVPAVERGEATTRIVFPTTVETVQISAGGVVTDTNFLEFAFPTTGWVTDLVATVAEGHQYCSLVSCKLRIQDVANIFTTGRSEAACPLSLLQGERTGNGSKASMFPIRRRVDSTMRWYIGFTSQSTNFPSLPFKLTPIVGAVFSEDALAT